MTEETLVLPAEMLGNIERYAVYRCYSDQGELLYIGESGELGVRFASHARKVWFQQVRGITLEWYVDELSALNAERRAIHIEHPKYNKQHRKTTSTQVARGKTRKRGTGTGRLVSDDELAELIMPLLEAGSDVTRYRVNKTIRDARGSGVRDERADRIMELARRKRVVPIGERKRA